MRFMMLMIPKGYENATPGTMPDAKAVEAMMKYNKSLQQAGVLLSLNGSTTINGRAGYVLRGQAESHRRPFSRSERGARRLLDNSGEVKGRSGRVGIALPRFEQ